MQFYADLLAGKTTLQDLTDEQLKELRRGWTDDTGRLHPTGGIWGAAMDEQRAREVARATKPKPFKKDFF